MTGRPEASTPFDQFQPVKVVSTGTAEQQAEKQALFDEMRRQLLIPRQPKPGLAPELTFRKFLRPDVVKAVWAADEDSAAVPLLGLIGSTGYPFVDGCPPDVIARRVAELVPGLRGQVAASRDGVMLAMHGDGSDGPEVAGVDIDLSSGEESPNGTDWRVIGWGAGDMNVTLTLPVSLDCQDDINAVIATLRAARVLPADSR